MAGPADCLDHEENSPIRILVRSFQTHRHSSTVTAVFATSILHICYAPAADQEQAVRENDPVLAFVWKTPVPSCLVFREKLYANAFGEMNASVKSNYSEFERPDMHCNACVTNH